MEEYRIGIAEERKNWDGELEPGSFNGFSWKFESIEQVRKVIEARGAKYWYIEKDWEKVEVSPAYQEWTDKEKKERDDHNKAQHEKVARINLLPTRFEVDTKGVEDLEMWIERSEYSFDPVYSSNVRGGFSVCYKSGWREDDHFWIDRYKSRDGKLLTSNFMKEAKYRFSKEAFLSIGKGGRILLSNIFKRLQEVKTEIHKA